MNGCISKGQISEHVVRKGPLASCPHHPCCPGHFLEGCKCEIWRQAVHALHEMVITQDHNCSLVLGRAGHLTVKHALSRASTFVQQLNFGGQHLKLTNPAVKLQEAFSVSFWLTFQWNLKQPPIFFIFIYHAALNIERSSELKSYSSRTQYTVFCWKTILLSYEYNYLKVT